MKECDHLPAGRRRICRGEGGLPLLDVNDYRRAWDVFPLQSLPEGAIVREETQRILLSQRKQSIQRLSGGAGTELVRILKGYGVPACQACRDLAAKMDSWGIESCRDRIEDIVDDMLPRAKDWIASKRRWIHSLLPDSVETFAVKLRLRGLINEAIESVESQKQRIPKQTNRRRNNLSITKKRDRSPIEAIEFNGSIHRNLIYHIYPVHGNGVWQWNVSQLLSRIDVFNGRKIVSIVTDNKTDSVEDVQDMFPSEIEFVVKKNKKRSGETVTFISMLRDVIDDDQNAITFYGHAKGVTRKSSERSVIQRWTESMYSACLDNVDHVERQLVDHGVVGAYRRQQQLGKARWYYSGTFYWFRHIHAFHRNWKYVDPKYWGSESWPGNLFNLNESSVLIADKVGSLYKSDELDRIKPQKITVTSPTQPLTLITPTGDRPEAFALCEKWMARQTIPYQWIVVDDGSIPTHCTQGQTYIRREPKRGTSHSLPNNLMAAIPHVLGEKVLIIEDDEWYADSYVARMSKWLDDDELVGVVPARYYWPREAKYREFPEHQHASLCRTGLRSSLLSVLAECCASRDPSIDIRLWARCKGRRHTVDLVVGMKQMPGRKSGGGSSDDAIIDSNLSTLRKWIGDDIDFYNSILPKTVEVDRSNRESIVVYTVVLGGYDTIRTPLVVNPNVRYVAITDGEAPSPWEVMRPPHVTGSHVIDSRRWKLNATELFPDADWTIYYDGQLQLACDPLQLLAECEAWGSIFTDLFLFRHQDRNCLYAEAAEVLRIRRDRTTSRQIAPQVARYRSDAFPEQAGLYLGGILVRRGGIACEKFNSTWWNELTIGSHRDQISLPVAIKRSGVNFAALPAMWWSHFFLRHKHKLLGPTRGYSRRKK